MADARTFIEQRFKAELSAIGVKHGIRFRTLPRRTNEIGILETGEAQGVIKVTGQRSDPPVGRLPAIQRRMYTVQIDLKVPEYSGDNGLNLVIEEIELALSAFEVLPGLPVYSEEDVFVAATRDGLWVQSLQFAVPFIFPATGCLLVEQVTSSAGSSRQEYDRSNGQAMTVQGAMGGSRQFAARSEGAAFTVAIALGASIQLLGRSDSEALNLVAANGNSRQGTARSNGIASSMLPIQVAEGGSRQQPSKSDGSAVTPIVAMGDSRQEPGRSSATVATVLVAEGESRQRGDRSDSTATVSTQSLFLYFF